jgi:hypothetical protein
MNEIRKFRAPDLVLAGRQFTFGQQPPIQRFSKTTVFPGVREMPRQILAAFTTPDDDVRVLFSVHILSARSFAQAASALFLPMNLRSFLFSAVTILVALNMTASRSQVF